MVDSEHDIEQMAARVADARGFLHIDDKTAELARLDEEIAAPGFWDDAAHAQGVSKQASNLRETIREYDEASCNTVEFVKCMRGAGVSIETLVEYMALYDQGDHTAAARKALLEEQRATLQARIADLQAGLDRLDYKIANYERFMADCDAKLKKEDGRDAV